MKNLTIDERKDLLNAVDYYLWVHNRPRTEWFEPPNGIVTIDLVPYMQLRAKLILDIAPMTIVELSPSNADYIKCCLCGNADDLQYPEMRGIISGFGNICNKCFSEHNPRLYKIACKETQKLKKEVEEYYKKEYPDQFNADGTLKQGDPVDNATLELLENEDKLLWE